MPRPGSRVGAIADVERTGAAGVGTSDATGDLAAVRLESEQSVRLTADEGRAPTWLSVLDSLRSAGLPVYLEVDGQNAVTEVLVPLRVVVDELTPLENGDVEIDLLISQAKHYLRGDSPYFEEFLALLEQSRADGLPLLVTETIDGEAVIDVRALPKELAGPVLPTSDEAGAAADVAAVSSAVAQQMFALANNRTCCSASPTAPGIPFTFPDDGCWGRAHEMARLMIAAGVQPEKVWIYGNLRVRTSNHPSCEVRWGWHVAPVLRVSTGSGEQIQVIDPALFPGPVPLATWAGVQGDPNASTVISPAAVFHRTFGGGVTYDPTYASTNQVLTTYRAQLQLRSASADGPPPYLQCLAPPPGTQFFGTLAANQTQRWFTFGWPASWHVAWSFMPITICSGAPQITWTVQVERADAGNVTYWLRVTNLTNRTVRFEGRYDVLSR